jgi:hypothetical protein
MQNISEFENFLFANLLGYITRTATSKKEADNFFQTFKKDLNKQVWDLLEEHDVAVFVQINAAIEELRDYSLGFGDKEKWCLRFVNNLKTHTQSETFEYSN